MANQVWAMDITYVPMARGFVYLAAVVDWFSRRVLAWSGSQLSPEEQRRQTFLTALEIQRNLWNDPSFTIKRRFRDDGDENSGRLTVLKSITPRAWWTTIGDLIEVAPRYGNRPLEITPGKFAARMKSDQVPGFAGFEVLPSTHRFARRTLPLCRPAKRRTQRMTL